MTDGEAKIGFAIIIGIFLIIETIIGCVFVYSLYNPGLLPC